MDQKIIDYFCNCNCIDKSVKKKISLLFTGGLDSGFN